MRDRARSVWLWLAIGAVALGVVAVDGAGGASGRPLKRAAARRTTITFSGPTVVAPPSAIQSTNAPPGGGDTDLNFDHTGKEYFVDLYALTCLRTATTPDGGATTSQSFNACGQTPGADRQWFAVYDPPAGTPHQSAYTGPSP